MISNTIYLVSAGDGGGDSGADWVHQQGRGQRDGEAGHRGCIPGHLPRPGPRHVHEPEEELPGRLLL